MSTGDGARNPAQQPSAPLTGSPTAVELLEFTEPGTGCRLDGTCD